MSSSRVWLVTGASSGFGLEMTRCALAHGEKVVATLRKPEVLNDFAAQYTSAQLLVVRLDVTRPEEIKEAFRKAKDMFGRVDVVFNNAGFVIIGEAEVMPDARAREIFEVDFWGAAHVSQEAVRFFRDENKPQGGHLIQNSAVAGLIAFPTIGFYGAAKHALEGFTETLHKEIDPAWNIKISSVLPGAFVTGMSATLQMMPQHPAYATPLSTTSNIRKWLIKGRDEEEAVKLGFGDSTKGVQKIYELSNLASPPLRLALGQDSVKYIKEYIAKLTNEVETYETWSDDLVYRED